MKMAFGILSLLVSVAIMLWLMVGSGYLSSVSKTNVQLKQQVNVMGGYDPGRTVMAKDSVHFRIDRTGSRPKLIVTEVMKYGPMQYRYDIRANDRVIEIGGLDFEQNIGSLDAALDWIHVAYSQDKPIVVIRDGKQVSLPTPEYIALRTEHERLVKIAAAQASAVQNAPPPAPNPTQERSTMQQVIDSMRGSDK